MAEPRWNRNLIALVVAWGVVLAALAGAAGYVVLQRLDTGSPGAEAQETVAVPQDEPRSGMVLELPAVQMPLASGSPDTGTGETSTAETGSEADSSAASDGQAAQTAAAEQSPATQPQGNAGSGADAEPAGAEQGEPASVSDAPSPQQEAPPAAPDQQASESAAEPADQGNAGHGDDAAEAEQAQAAQDEGAPQQEAALPPGNEPPWQQYATAFDQDKPGPRVAIVLSGLGLSAAATEAAIKQLPPEITLSFSPYARLLNQWIALARANGHEVMLDLPMEPLTFPEDDPGPHALLTVLDEQQNEKRLDWLLRRGTSYVGVSVVMGSRFTASEEHMQPVLESLKQRGLLLLDNRSSEESAAPALADQLDLPLVVNDRTLDSAQASRVAINARLSEIERLARENGAAVAMAQPYPVTIERLRDWSLELPTRGFVLAPITALATTTLAKEQASEQ